MWPLKAHYTLWFGSLSGILPYVPVYAKTHLEVSASQVGLLYFLLPFVVSFIKPLACSGADHYHQHSVALLISQFCTLLGYGLLLAIPFLAYILHTSLWWYLFCLLALLANTSMGVGISLTDFLVMDEVARINQSGGDTHYGKFRIWGTIGFGLFGAISGLINAYQLFSSLPYLFPGLFMFVVIEIADIVCVYWFYHRKRSSPNPISATNNHELTDITPQALSNRSNQTCLARISETISNSLTAVRSTFRQVIRIYVHYPSLLQHTFIVFCFGILTAFHWSFFFWFLEEIRGKDPLLMGLCMLVNSFPGEIPIFLVAHKIIQWFGPVLSFCISLSAFAVRYLCYGLLLQKEYGKYWDVLLIEVLQGLTFSLFYTVMTHVAQHYANKCDKLMVLVEPKAGHQLDGDAFVGVQLNGETQQGTSEQEPHKPSATMQSIMSACYEGLGLGVGSLLGGFIIDRYGVRAIWTGAAYFSIALVAFNLAIEAVKWRRRRAQ